MKTELATAYFQVRIFSRVCTSVCSCLIRIRPVTSDAVTFLSCRSSSKCGCRTTPALGVLLAVLRIHRGQFMLALTFFPVCVLKTVRDNCFNKCITRPGTSMSKSEVTCMANCCDRYIDVRAGRVDASKCACGASCACQTA